METASATPPRRRPGIAKFVLLTVLGLSAAAGGYEGYQWWINGRYMETTDDAYVKADITVLLSKVSGYVTSVAVEDNQPVHAGDVLVRLDDGDYKLAVQSARDGIEKNETTVARIEKQIDAARASVLQAEAGVRSAKAKLAEAKANYQRQEKLVARRIVTQAVFDTANATLKSAKAALADARAAVTLAKAQIDVLQAERDEALQAVKSAVTDLDKAQRNLKFTVIQAPVDGIVSHRAAQVGSFLQSGSRVAAIVPAFDTHIDANFKETQLEHIAPGAKAVISVDAYPDSPIEGRVESIAPATGSEFSLLPAENATGNFTKVVQRVPVRIAVPQSEQMRGHLRAGMSVVVKIDTRTGGTGSSIVERQ